MATDKARKPKVLIVVMFQNLLDEPPYEFKMWTPPATGILLASLTPPLVDVEVVHEMVQPIDWSTDADFVALSFWDLHSPHAFRVAKRFREMGKAVVAGGRYPTSNPDACQPHFDSVVVGDAQPVWPQVVRDLVSGCLKSRYTAPHFPDMNNLPPPRYDLAERSFRFPVSTEASRGCRFNCDYCQLTVDDRFRRLRLRPIEDVVNDLTATKGIPFWSRTMANLVDNNLASHSEYAKQLLRAVSKLKLWGLFVQFTVDNLRDDEFIDALVAARTKVAFMGLESLDQPSLTGINKNQNRVDEYRDLLGKLKRNNIVSFCGFMIGLDGETSEYYQDVMRRLDEAGPDVLLITLAIPIPGTPWARKLEEDGRILDDDLSLRDGDHLVYQPRNATPREVLQAYGRAYRDFYSWRKILSRFWRFLRAKPWLGLTPKTGMSTVIASVVFFHLTLLYRNRAKARVFPILKQELAKATRRGSRSARGTSQHHTVRV